MSEETTDLVRCASYTHARRHPMVLGQIAGWTPPFQLTVTQILVLLGTFIALVWSWSLWARFLPSTIALMVAAGLPTGAAWVVRRVRVEGRSLVRAGVGYVALWCGPSQGTIAGRPHRAPRHVRTAGQRIWLESRS